MVSCHGICWKLTILQLLEILKNHNSYVFAHIVADVLTMDYNNAILH